MKINRQSPEFLKGQVRKASRMYEEQFLRQMVKSMRGTVTHSKLTKPSMGEKIYNEQLDEEYVKQWADSGGAGLADLIYEDIIEKYYPQLAEKPRKRQPLKKPTIPIRGIKEVAQRQAKKLSTNETLKADVKSSKAPTKGNEKDGNRIGPGPEKQRLKNQIKHSYPRKTELNQGAEASGPVSSHRFRFSLDQKINFEESNRQSMGIQNFAAQNLSKGPASEKNQHGTELLSPWEGQVKFLYKNQDSGRHEVGVQHPNGLMSVFHFTSDSQPQLIASQPKQGQSFLKIALAPQNIDWELRSEAFFSKGEV